VFNRALGRLLLERPMPLSVVAHSVELVSQFARPWRWMVCSGT
jgi:hypothetical protein